MDLSRGTWVGPKGAKCPPVRTVRRIQNMPPFPESDRPPARESRFCKSASTPWKVNGAKYENSRERPGGSGDGTGGRGGFLGTGSEGSPPDPDPRGGPGGL